jgi:Uma2 family endonuclease
MLALMLDRDDLAPDRIRKIMRAEYDQMVRAGIFDEDERMELLRGELVAMSPIGLPHRRSVTRLNMMLARQVGLGLEVQPQCPLALWDDSEPEPDLAVVNSVTSFDRWPDNCLLVIEVADSSFRKDSTIKAALYAEAGIPVYWLVDVNRSQVLVHTLPRDGSYRRIDRQVPGDVLTLDGQPGIAVPVSEIVPPVGA